MLSLLWYRLARWCELPCIDIDYSPCPCLCSTRPWLRLVWRSTPPVLYRLPFLQDTVWLRPKADISSQAWSWAAPLPGQAVTWLSVEGLLAWFGSVCASLCVCVCVRACFLVTYGWAHTLLGRRVCCVYMQLQDFDNQMHFSIGCVFIFFSRCSLCLS